MNSWTTNRSRILEEAPPTTAYFHTAYAFALDWLNGKQHYSLSTSGSTGTPKTILISREQMVASAKMTGRALHLPSKTRALVCLNVEYIAGIMMLVRGLELDWEMTIIEPISNPLRNFNSEISFDFVAMVPLQLFSTIQDQTIRQRVGQFGKILLGGAPVSLALQKEIEKLEVPVYQSYGMTETVSHVALRLLNGHNMSGGFSMLDDIDFGVDERGCLFINGAVTNFQKVQTNDLVELGLNRTFKWLGRIDSIINSGGIKIQLNKTDLKIEEVLLLMNLQYEFFSWSEPDEKLGQKLVVFMKGLKSEFDESSFFEKLRLVVKPYEIPKAVYFVNKFEKTVSDKINKIATAQKFFNAQL